MALIKCPHCGKPVSDRAVKCPHCGTSFQPPRNTNVRGNEGNATYQTDNQENDFSGGVSVSVLFIIIITVFLAIILIAVKG